MRQASKEIWMIFWNACKETPRGMFLPFVAFWHTAIHNPVLEKSSEDEKIIV